MKRLQQNGRERLPRRAGSGSRGRGKESEASRDESVARIRGDFRKRLASEGKRYRTRVAIPEGGRGAVIAGGLFEKLTRREGTLSAISDEIYVLRLRGGKLFAASYVVATRAQSFE